MYICVCLCLCVRAGARYLISLLTNLSDPSFNKIIESIHMMYMHPVKTKITVGKCIIGYCDFTSIQMYIIDK